MLLLFIGSISLFQVYKVIVNVGQQEWFVFRRYAEFDKLYNIVSGSTVLQFCFHLTLVYDSSRLIFLLVNAVTETVSIYELENSCQEDIWGQFWTW